jgi:hypothetical protein
VKGWRKEFLHLGDILWPAGQFNRFPGADEPAWSTGPDTAFAQRAVGVLDNTLLKGEVQLHTPLVLLVPRRIRSQSHIGKGLEIGRAEELRNSGVHAHFLATTEA